MIVELRRRQLYEAAAELRAVSHMLRAGQDAWFVDPRKRVGHTYDGVVILSGIEVAVEVKAKRPQPVDAFRPNLIENSLRSARKQLPRDAPSMIYLQIPSPWSDDPATMRAVEETIRHWLRSTGHVNAVHLLLERTFVRSDTGISLAHASFFISNPQPRYPVPDLLEEDP